jgi:FtsH-binding integral membrane protein
LLYKNEHERRIFMLFTVAAVFVILWLLGLITSNTMGGFIHILLVIAVIAILVRVIRGQKIL